MRITIVIPSLVSGGAERVAVLHAAGFAARGHFVSVITLAKAETDSFALPPAIERIGLDLIQTTNNPVSALNANARRLQALRVALIAARPDIVISHINQTNALTALAARGADYKLIAVEHSGSPLKAPPRAWRALRRLTYRRADKIVFVSRAAADYFTWLPDAKKSVIYNPLVFDEAKMNAPLPPTGADETRPWIVAMGRLLPVKGFDLLLRAFAATDESHADWQLVILGEGAERAALERLRDESNLRGRAFLPGRFDNPFPVLGRSKFFALPSRAEGLPYAALEALACGLPIVANEYDGAAEAVRHEIDGIIVANENPAEFTRALNGLMEDTTRRAQMAVKACEAQQRFSLDAALDKWEAEFARLGLSR